jgi:hypothetical protein
MDHVTCTACNRDTVPRPPNRSFWALIVSFWAFSLLFGIGAAISGWSVILLVAWLLMACTVGVLSQRATSWTCSECGSTVLPPATATTTHAQARRPLTTRTA